MRAHVENMHRRKTGALDRSERATWRHRGRSRRTAPQRQALEQFGADIGLAFQIQDDILDVEGDAALLGKSAGADAARRKPTYPSTVGIEASRQRAAELRDRAVAALAPLGARAQALVDLAHYIVSRAQ